MIRVILTIAAVGMIGLGIWLIAIGCLDTSPPTATAPQVITASRQAVSPVIPGAALLAGGVVFLVLIFGGGSRDMEIALVLGLLFLAIVRCAPALALPVRCPRS